MNLTKLEDEKHAYFYMATNAPDTLILLRKPNWSSIIPQI